MPALTLARDADGLPAEPAIRTALRALAQRGTKLHLGAEGGVITAQRNGKTAAIAWLARDAVQGLAAVDWLTACDTATFILSPVGRDIVRRLKAAPSPAAAGAGASPPPPPAAPLSAQATTVPDVAGSLAWLRARRDKGGQPYLSAEAFQAGERLRAEFHRAHMNPRVTVDLDAVPRTRDEQRGAAGGMRDIPDSRAAAAERVRRALAAVPAELSGLMLDVCCHDLGLQVAEIRHGAPQRSAHFLLKIALNELARHYGLLPPAQSTWAVPARTRHWGTDDFRPKI